ncbi:protein THEM6 [Microplitis mediator]|uniref:protein THEM6 n=1 Tax=Microplitis mediator TaxID=375433 RepID=UPI00255710DA|nr:protein THEM6 [Microplitis mediator]XP_057334822.1 protein THEM6 [Microplitis mediator]XP_057334823.1 protein THEM6 [Microplitis mediator]
MLACWVLVGVFGTIVLLYALIEVHYFLRMFLTVLLARFCKKPVHILDETTIYGLCTTTDLDTLLYHMNNSRYLRELDFARADFYERTSLYREICSQGKGVVQGAATIRYRRFLKPLSIFKIKSKIIYWDDKSIFMEHKFITPHDDFVRAIAVCRQRLLDCSAETVMSTLLERGVKQNGSVEVGVTQTHVRPEMPPDLAKWLESNDISSAILRGTDTSSVVTTN